MLCALLLLACGGGSDEVPDVSGVWEGELAGAGVELRLRASFTVDDDGITGTLDIPQQQARGLPLADFRQAGDSLSFVLPLDQGRAEFRGVVSGDTLRGLFQQNGFSGSFILERTSMEEEAASPGGEEVVITGDDCVLAGTLTLPSADPPHPCLVLLSGSGLQDRDEYVMGFPVFGELARILDASGYAVLRCDDRGTGGSSGDMGSFSDSMLVYDAGLMLDHVLNDPRIDPGRVGLLGHSEGSTTAFALAAERAGDVAFVISIAGPAVPGYELLPSQLRVLLPMQGYTQEETEEKLQAQYIVMDAVLAGDTALVDSVLRAQTEEQLQRLSEEELASLGDLDMYIEQATGASAASAKSLWFRRFLAVDPVQYIREVDVPVLCLYAELDVHVIPETNLGPMEEALADNPDHSIVVFEDANHLFQEALTGEVMEYAVLESAFIEGFADTISAWLESL
ncbi:MAG: hypothetical protein AVO35_12995 [Candidatus Aegiribacteria sp. MLS_C]|nr:MAG: hypothetical protein AVO35_12995 [Candidatus Aegiribacteria sp. MLS_C]